MKHVVQIFILVGLTSVVLTDCRRDKKNPTPEPTTQGTLLPPSDWDGTSDWSSSLFEVIQE